MANHPTGLGPATREPIGHYQCCGCSQGSGPVTAWSNASASTAGSRVRSPRSLASSRLWITINGYSGCCSSAASNMHMTPASCSALSRQLFPQHSTQWLLEIDNVHYQFGFAAGVQHWHASPTLTHATLMSKPPSDPDDCCAGLASQAPSTSL